MSNDTTPPIEVTDNTLDGQITTLARYLVTAIGSYALGRGWIDGHMLQLLVALVTVIAPTAWGIYKTFVHKTQLITVAEAAPNRVAKVVAK
jgi:hypothetical protein